MQALVVFVFMGEGAKAILFGGIVVALLFLANRFSSSRTSGAYPQNTVETPAEAAPEAVESIVATTDDARATADVHPEMRFGDVLLRSLYFKSFDALTGPPEPGCFLDELTLELQNLETGYRYEMNYIVGTPEGLRRKIAEEKFVILSLPQFYAVDHYDLKLIRETLLALQDEDEKAVLEPAGPHNALES